MAINCDFIEFTSITGEEFYMCKITKQEIPPEIFPINLFGLHLDEKSNNDVDFILFDKCDVPKIPKGITKVFPNLKVLDIDFSNLKEINKSDLEVYKQLERFSSNGNDVEFLAGDIFEGFKNLTWVTFFANKLRVVEPNILDGLENLKVVDFTQNPNFNRCYSMYHEHNHNSTFDEVKGQIFEQFFASDPENIKSYLKKLRKRPQENLFNDLKNLISDETSKDLQIIIDGHEFPVHKFLLAARSPTLAEILKNNPEVENLNLVDISVEIFETILKFLYTDEFPGGNETNFLSLFAAASRFRIKELKNYAANKICELIRHENIFEILNLSNKFDHDWLRQAAFDEIKRNYQKIDFEDEWAKEPERIVEIIDGFREKEEAVQKIEEKFAKLLGKKMLNFNFFNF